MRCAPQVVHSYELAEGATVSKSGVTTADGDQVGFKSPRMVQALLETGVTMAELRPARITDLILADNKTMAELHVKALEQERLKCLQMVLTKRLQLVGGEERLVPMVVLTDGRVTADADIKVEIDTGALDRESQRMDKILTGFESRFDAEKQRLEVQQEITARKQEMFERADTAFLQKKQEQLVTKQRKAQEALDFQVQRAIMKEKELLDANAFAKKSEEGRIAKQEALGRARLEREMVIKEQSLAFLKKQGERIEAIQAANIEKEVNMAALGRERAEKMFAAERMREDKAAEEKAKRAAEAAAKAAALDTRLATKKNEREEAAEVAVRRQLEKLDGVAKRLAEADAKKAAELCERQARTKMKELERAHKAEAREQARLEQVAAMVKAKEEKDTATLLAIRRKEEAEAVKVRRRDLNPSTCILGWRLFGDVHTAPVGMDGPTKETTSRLKRRHP